MMQAAVALSAVLPVTVRGRPAARRRSATVAGGRRIAGASVRASAAAAPEADYSSSVSVFPMEACDLVGGEACDAQMYPETKLGAGAGGPLPPSRGCRRWRGSTCPTTSQKRCSRTRRATISAASSARRPTRPASSYC